MGVAPHSQLFLVRKMNGNDCQEESAAGRWTHRASSDDRRVGNVGAMLIEAAKQGLLDSLELLLELPQGTREIKISW